MSDDAPLDPWASDTIPPSSGLGDLDWRTGESDASDASNASGGLDAPRPSTRVSAPPPSAPDQPAAWGRRGLLAVGALVVVFGAVFALVVVGDDSNDADGVADTIAPEIEITLPDASVPTTVAPPTTRPAAPETTDAAIPPVGDPLPLAATVELLSFDLPPELARITEPTEIIGITSDRRLVTLSLPSGVAQILDLSDVGEGFGSEVAATPDFALVRLTSGLYTVDGTGALSEVTLEGADSLDIPSFTDFSRLGWIRRSDGSSAALVQTFDGDGGLPGALAVDANGVATPLDLPLGLSFNPPASGTLIVNDAGGSYRIDDASDASRIGGGFTFVTNEQFALQRRCDEVLRCAFVVADLATGDTRDVTLPPDAFPFGMTLSPDASSVAFISVTGQSDRVIVDLTTGESVSSVTTREVSGGWASDSSGEFVLLDGGDLTFVDAETGVATPLDVDLGSRFSFFAISVRQAATIEIPSTTDIDRAAEVEAAAAEAAAEDEGSEP